MQWRNDAFGDKLRYANPFRCSSPDNPCICNCGFEQQMPNGQWIYPAFGVELNDQLVGDNLLGRQGNPATATHRAALMKMRSGQVAKMRPPATPVPSLVAMKR